MVNASDISKRFWDLPTKADEETEREEIFIDDIIQKAHIEKELLSKLDGIRTVFDGGAGYGRFSILLAKQGLQVTHFDISSVMIDKAKEIAAKEGVLSHMTFVQGSLEDLSAFHDQQFDLVLSFDAPISYTYPNQAKVIGELCRICSKRMVISVYSRLGWTYLFDPAQKRKYILNESSHNPIVQWTMEHGMAQRPHYRPDMQAVRDFFQTGLMEQPEHVASEYQRGNTPWPISYTFLPEELEEILTQHGARNIKLAGPGALSRSIPHEVLVNIMQDPDLKEEFLNFCYWYDGQPGCAGMGKDNLVACMDM